MGTCIIELTADELHVIETALLRERARFVAEAKHYREISQQLAESCDSSGARAALHRSGRMNAAQQMTTALLAKLD